MAGKDDDGKEEWIDPDDAPELTDEDFARGVWSIGGRTVSRAEGQAAAAARRRRIWPKAD